MKKSLKHEMVPTHEILSKKEGAELLKKFNIIKAQLPIIFSNDPALKNLEVKPGDMIKITRENSVVGTNYAYRVVR